mgnify:CR=1 FL=1
MKILIVPVVFLCLVACQQQERKNESRADKIFNKTLAQRVKDIEKLDYFDKLPTFVPDSGITAFYDSLTYHPYRYFRDTAAIKDLNKLTDWPHPMVRSYAFYALLHRKQYQLLFPMVLKHLTDTVSYEEMDYDIIYSNSPGEVMLSNSLRYLTTSQKDSLKHLILTKYQFLGVNGILFFLKPEKKYYEMVRKLAQTPNNEGALIALAKYQREQDIPIIRKGLEKIDFNSGIYMFFQAIALFPHATFLPDLLAFTNNLKENQSVMDDYVYYYMALASYQKPECLKRLEKMAERKYYSSRGYWETNIIHIHRALKRYYTDEYQPLIKKLEKQYESIQLSDDLAPVFKDIKEPKTRLERRSPWNY